MIMACMALSLVTGACGRKDDEQKAMPVSATIGQAVKMDTPIIISAFGNTEDKVSIDIIPQVSGILQKIHIKDGEVVKAGQMLFEIDKSEYQARVKQVEGIVKADKANLELARKTFERNKPLFEKKLISTENFDTLRTKFQSVEAQLQMDQAALETAKINLSRGTIKAPRDGVCSKRYMDEGNLATAGMSKLTNIRSYDPIRVAFSVSEQYLPRIRDAMASGKVKIEIIPRGETNSYSGTLEFVDNAVNPATGTILLRGEVPNPGLKLWANQFVDVRIFSGVVPGAIMVPESTVMFGKRGPYLFAVTKEGKADMRMVKIGIRYNELIQVIEGVTAGEPVVVLGQYMMYPGATVMDLSKMPPPGASMKGNNPAAKKGQAREEKKPGRAGH